MKTTTGTAHYTSFQTAKKSYYDMTQTMVDEGSIIIGKPELKPGQKLLVNKRGRYLIECSN